LISRTTSRFRALYQALPQEVQEQASSAYNLFKQNPRHPSLQFKPVSAKDSTIYSARVGTHYRAIGSLVGDTITWTWIGSHAAYDAVTRPNRSSTLQP
jgi:mRNA-degrading endonuclease RelE of RelBE toxin-antitoxin system